MIEAEHLPHPQNLPDILLENNAMLHHVLNNQAFILEMITATYQLLRYHIYKNPTPEDKFIEEKGRLADLKYKAYQQNVSDMFDKLKSQYNQKPVYGQ